MIQAITTSQPDTRDRVATSLFGSNTESWQLQREWQPIHQTAIHHFSGIRKDAILKLIQSAFDSRRPAVELISDDTVAVAVPHFDRSPLTASVSYLPAEKHTLVALAQKAAQGLWDQEQELRQHKQANEDNEEQLVAYASQVSADLEELLWLRRLACNLELSESGNSAEHIAETVLPSLCELIYAQTVVFIRDVPLDSDDKELPVICQTGFCNVTEDTGLQLTEILGNKSNGQPVVMNDWSSGLFVEAKESSQRYEIDSCVLVPVATSSMRLGWLMALNKDTFGSSQNPRLTGPEYATYLSETEFGTFEASLMNATAVILAAHGRNCSLFREKELLLKGVIRSMINAIDAKDSYTCGHSDRVAEFARMIAKELQLPPEQCEQIHMTGLLHDVGKIGVPDSVLKKPGQLTDAEFEQIKQHPVIGHEILKHLKNLSYVLPGVLHHHESVDGSGYPHGLKGDDIPLIARILAVADSYDAMTSNRPYRRGMATARAEQIIRDGAGKQWDSECVEAFFRTIESVRNLVNQHAAPLIPP